MNTDFLNLSQQTQYLHQEGLMERNPMTLFIVNLGVWALKDYV